MPKAAWRELPAAVRTALPLLQLLQLFIIGRASSMVAITHVRYV
jgi:hypothetical protein